MPEKHTRKYSVLDCCKVAKDRNGKCLSRSYKNNKTKMKWQCENSHIWYAEFARIKKGHWCRKCFSSRKRKYSIEDLKRFASNKGGKCLSSKFVNVNKTKYLWQCSEGHEWKARFFDVFVKKTWCSVCAQNKRKTIEDCHKIARMKKGLCLSEKYINSKTKYRWQCKERTRVFYEAQ